ncbi:uncharacterized protein C7orf50 homolog [Ceratina calcarata]|uniref:Uncharacterized protein C7orf50 homolog n=1 Tax=Ceratina calcarata TaxID=156304 RepID=A0AAJ7J0N9_9HYME|nr:uncharacterized protein C7orf50 homolog [Ceratina calcarata]
MFDLTSRKKTMGSEGTSQVEVKNSKSRKRTKKKEGSKGITSNANNDSLENDTNNVEEVSMKHKKRKEKKESNTDHNSKEVIQDSKENDSAGAEAINEEKSDNEASPPKKKTIDTENDFDENGKNNTKSPKQPSKRQLKKERAERKENEKRMAIKIDAMKKGLNYVSTWKYARSEWKFEKLRQIWLIDNLLDETSIPDDIFPTVLEYFEGCKGMARELLLKKGMDAIKKIEENVENKEELESVAYQRARKLLQALPIDT